MRKSLATVSLFLLLTPIADAAPKSTGRVMYTTLIRSRVEAETPAGAGDAVQRAVVSLKNISGIKQTVKISFLNLRAQSEAGFATVGEANSYNPPWVTNAIYPNWKILSDTLQDTSKTIVLDPNGTGEFTISMKCNFQNMRTCAIGEPPMAPASNVKGAVFMTELAAVIEVAEDRGAVLADLFTQILIGVPGGKTSSESETRPINGGRPF